MLFCMIPDTIFVFACFDCSSHLYDGHILSQTLGFFLERQLQSSLYLIFGYCSNVLAKRFRALRINSRM